MTEDNMEGALYRVAPRRTRSRTIGTLVRRNQYSKNVHGDHECGHCPFVLGDIRGSLSTLVVWSCGGINC